MCLFEKVYMERFFTKVTKTDSCWEWSAAKRGKSGYGAFKVDGKVVDAHRISYKIHFGEVPNGLCVCHKCDNRMCVRPDHLFLGTHSDNMKDCYKKGRMTLPTSSRFKKGAVPKNANTDVNLIIAIKKDIANRSGSLKMVAEKHGVSESCVRDISSGRTYKSINP